MNTTTRLDSRTHLDAGLGLLRVVIGSVFVAHGVQKLFVFGVAGLAQGFADIGVPLAGIVGPVVGFAELLGGIALMLGLFTRIAALGLAVIMLGAMVLVHLPAGFFLPDGVEFTFTLFAGLAALALTGPGAFSVDAVLGRRRARAPAPAARPASSDRSEQWTA